MAFVSKVYQVMIASPGDVIDEREIIRKAIYKFNDNFSYREKTVLLPVSWETHAYPETGDHPQKQINRQMLEQCDLLIGVFGTKLGTATEEYLSGTLEEIYKHIKSGKKAMLYFSKEPVPRERKSMEEAQRLEDFKDSIFNNNDDVIKGYIENHKDKEHFREIFPEQLQRMIFQNDEFLLEHDLHLGYKANQINEVSNEAITLLKEASQGEGKIARVKVKEGLIIQVNGKIINETGNARDEAFWHSAVDELLDLEFIRPIGKKGHMYEVSKNGYEYGDNLT